MTGPAAVVALAVVVDPAAALLAALGLALVGTVCFALQRATEPQPGGRGGPRAKSALRVAGLRTLTASMLAEGALFGSLEVAMVAFADEHGNRAAAGLLLPLVALARGAAGLLYGARTWHSPLDRRFVLALVALTAGTLPLLVAPGLVGMAFAALGAGVGISPSLIASFGLAERLVPAAAHTEGFTWLNTGLNGGVAVGASAAGALADGPGPRWAFGVCVAGAFLALAVAGAGRASLVPAAVVHDTPA